MRAYPVDDLVPNTRHGVERVHGALGHQRTTSSPSGETTMINSAMRDVLEANANGQTAVRAYGAMDAGLKPPARDFGQLFRFGAPVTGAQGL